MVLKPIIKKLQAWADYCDELINTEDYPTLRSAGKKGIALANADDPHNLSLFYFYTTITFNYSTEIDSAEYFLNRSEEYGIKANNIRRISQALKQLFLVTKLYKRTEKRKSVLSKIQVIIDTTTNSKFKSDMLETAADY